LGAADILLAHGAAALSCAAQFERLKPEAVAEFPA